MSGGPNNMPALPAGTGGPGSTPGTFGYGNIVDTAGQLESTIQDLVNNSSSSMSIKEMFQIQLASNKFSQFSEMATSVFSAKNQAVMSAARGLK